jgi:hypothetical protein
MSFKSFSSLQCPEVLITTHEVLNLIQCYNILKCPPQHATFLILFKVTMSWSVHHSAWRFKSYSRLQCSEISTTHHVLNPIHRYNTLKCLQIHKTFKSGSRLQCPEVSTTTHEVLKLIQCYSILQCPPQHTTFYIMFKFTTSWNLRHST